MGTLVADSNVLILWGDIHYRSNTVSFFGYTRWAFPIRVSTVHLYSVRLVPLEQKHHRCGYCCRLAPFHDLDRAGNRSRGRPHHKVALESAVRPLTGNWSDVQGRISELEFSRPDTHSLGVHPNVCNASTDVRTGMWYWLKSKVGRLDVADGQVYLRTALEVLLVEDGNSAELTRVLGYGVW